ncbi:MAG TPA: HAD-IB family hydrolase [Candidatus Nanopelagicaceae bacterium]|nr:HAD-IB family hydrolase [Candidatus Nanopelagicaceae bacterium]
MEKSAAFFDVDNTLSRGSTLFLFARGLYRRGFFSTRTVLKFALAQARFRLSGKEKAKEIANIRKAALIFVRGHRTSELADIAEEIYDESISRALWSGTVDLAKEHLAAGRQVWLVTASPLEMGEVIARRLGFTGALGSIAESINGVYTGELVGELLHGGAKATAVLRLSEETGLNLANCFAYSDSSNDLPLLEAVGHPCAINPDARLRRHAKANAWPISDYRRARRAARMLAPVVAAIGAVAALFSQKPWGGKRR